MASSTSNKVTTKKTTTPKMIVANPGKTGSTNIKDYTPVNTSTKSTSSKSSSKFSSSSSSSAQPKVLVPDGKGGYTPYDSLSQIPATSSSQSGTLPQMSQSASTYVPPGTQAATQTIAQPKTKVATDPTFSGILQDLLKKANSGDKNVNKAREDLTAFQKATSDKVADIKSTPIPLEFQQGRAQVVQQASAEKEAALQTGVTNALTQQQQQLTALAAAAGLATPTQVSQGNSYTDPVTGKTIAYNPLLSDYGQTFYNPSGQNSVGVSPSDPFYKTMQTYAQLLASNQGNQIPSSITGNPALSAQIQTMARTLNPSFNSNTSAGIAGAQQQFAQTAGTFEQGANVGIYDSALASVANIENQIANVDQLGRLLYETTAQGGINPTDVRFANATIAEIRRQLSSGAQATFDNTISTLRARSAELLAAGGNITPTDAGNKANMMLPDTLPLSALGSVLDRIKEEGQIIANNQKQIAAKSFTNAKGNTSSTKGTSSTGTYTSGGVTFKKVGNKWVVAK